MTQFYASTPAIGLCLYDRKRLDPLTLDGALRTHPTALTADACCDVNPFFESLDLFCQRFDARERFEWKLGRLCAVVEDRGASTFRLSPATAR